MFNQLKTGILQKVKVRTKWLRERPLQVQVLNGLGGLTNHGGISIQQWDPLRVLLLKALLKLFPFPAIPGNRSLRFPFLLKNSIFLPVKREAIFDSRSLPEKREFDFQFPIPFPVAKKPFPLTTGAKELVRRTHESESGQMVSEKVKWS